jgi:hypothetical protein
MRSRAVFLGITARCDGQSKGEFAAFGRIGAWLAIRTDP